MTSLQIPSLKFHNLQNLPSGQILHKVAKLLIFEFYPIEFNHFYSMEITYPKSTLNMQTTKEKIYKIRDLNKKFRKACSQLIYINNMIEEIEVRYKRVEQINRRSYRYILRLRLLSLEGVRNMFYDYAHAKADILEKMQLELYNKTGLVWNDALAEESNSEISDDEDEDDDMEIEI